MPDPVGSLSIASANTEFLAVGQEVFDRPMDGQFSIYTGVHPCNGLSMELDALGAAAGVSELTGSRPGANIRAYARRVQVKPYTTPVLELPRNWVENDKTGMVSARLRDYLNANAAFWDGPTTAALLANGTCIDGVALLSNTHPYAAGGSTWDNLAAAFTSVTLYAAWEAMTSLTTEWGEPMNIKPTHLMVGPSLEQEAMDLLGVNRGIPYNTSGAPDAASSVIAAIQLENWLKGRLQLIVNPRIVGSGYSASWFLMDLSKPGVRPMAVGQAIAPRSFVVQSGEAEPMLQRSAYAYYCEGYAAISPHMPHCIHGYIA